ncbi:MAG: beta-galactosidase trimerization domain-containing protein, partial [Roseiflexaceae bacterium]
VGHVYREVAKREAWCVDATAVTDIAVFSLEKPVSASWADAIPPATFGVVRMLEELAMQFDIVDAQADLSRYALLILPDVLDVDAALAAKIEAYVAGGGRLLVSYHSGVRDGQMQLACTGVDYVGEIAMSPDFVVPSVHMGSDLPRTGHAMYLRGAHVTPRVGTNVLAGTIQPYFERSWRHFCSHRHTHLMAHPGQRR